MEHVYSRCFPTQDPKNCWRSAEELRKIKDSNGQRPSMTFNRCDCRDKASGKENDCCFLKSQSILETIEPKCNIQKESNMLKQPQRQVGDSE